ncbi:MAG: LuxR family transcriptional regulator [Hyphomicrobiaceae bacterium]|nr:LuxR family transcriptional regulator [Hyphomicrobiaceae bacterium]
MDRNSCATRAFEAFNKLQNAKTQAEIEHILLEELRFFGFQYVTCSDMPAPGQDPIKAVLLNTRPLEYVEHYISNRHIEKDPAITELKNSSRTFSWSDLKATRNLSLEQRRIIDEASEFNVHDGLTIPFATTTGGYALVCPCGERPDLSPEPRAAIELISISALQYLKRRIAEDRKKTIQAKKVQLTEREREILQWIIVGKTDEEVGIILSISARTVQSHVNNARAKLNTANRTQAVAEALRRGELSL